MPIRERLSASWQLQSRRLVLARSWNSENARWLWAVELGLLLLTALVFGANYLNLDENIVPTGNEFHWVIQTHHF